MKNRIPMKCLKIPQILNDEDLNSMNHSIENRSPFIDKIYLNFYYHSPKYFIKNGLKNIF